MLTPSCSYDVRLIPRIRRSASWSVIRTGLIRSIVSRDERPNCWCCGSVPSPSLATTIQMELANFRRNLCMFWIQLLMYSSWRGRIQMAVARVRWVTNRCMSDNDWTILVIGYRLRRFLPFYASNYTNVTLQRSAAAGFALVHALELSKRRTAPLSGWLCLGGRKCTVASARLCCSRIPTTVCIVSVERW
jgi:hypothetical protein